MNNSVLPQNSLIRGAIGRNVTKKNIGRWQKKNKNASIYNKYMKNMKNIYSSFASTMSNNNSTTINGTNEVESIYSSSPSSSEEQTNNSNSGGEFSKLIRRYKAEGQNSSFGSFATRRLKKSRRSGGYVRRRYRRRTHSKK